MKELCEGRWLSAQTNVELAWLTVGTNAVGVFQSSRGSNLGQKTTIMTGNFRGCYKNPQTFLFEVRHTCCVFSN